MYLPFVFNQSEDSMSHNHFHHCLKSVTVNEETFISCYCDLISDTRQNIRANRSQREPTGGQFQALLLIPDCQTTRLSFLHFPSCPTLSALGSHVCCLSLLPVCATWTLEWDRQLETLGSLVRSSLIPLWLICSFYVSIVFSHHDNSTQLSLTRLALL